jgi:hypothetical protein
MNLSTTRSKHLPFCTQESLHRSGFTMCLPLLGFLPHPTPDNFLYFQQHSRLMRVTPFVFYDIPGSALPV